RHGHRRHRPQTPDDPPQRHAHLIYGDDVGFADVGVNGSKLIPTPHIDKLAAEGLNFTDGHCPAATCSASRYTMLTGELAWRRGIVILGPTSAMPIKPETYTLPRVFKDAGYATAVIGKWHLGLGSEGTPVDWNGDVKPGPLEIGFDYSFLLPNTNDRVPCVYLENYRVPNLDPNDPLSLNERIDPRQTEYPDGRKSPEAMTYYMNSHGHNHSVINGIGRIGTQFGGKSALWDDETMGDVFLEKTEAWMDQHVKENPDQPFFMFLPSQMIHVPRTPHPRYHGKTQLGYRGDAMVELDDSVGTIMKMLEKHGISDDTMVIFSSDNGPVYDDGYQDGTVTQTSTKEMDQGHDGSGPYRGGKYQIYEGGTRVPFIVRWPAGIKPGQSKALVSHTDVMASFAHLFGVDIPEGAAPDSQNASAALIGEDPKGNPYMIEETGRQLALRKGPWKVIMAKPRRKKGKKTKDTPPPAPTFQFYNLETDIGETTDIAQKFPDEFEAMKKTVIAISEGQSVLNAIKEK
ncbi:MAG: arylsulfatase, partial [Verrucomicrobiota bacterium]